MIRRGDCWINGDEITSINAHGDRVVVRLTSGEILLFTGDQLAGQTPTKFAAALAAEVRRGPP